MATGEVMMPGMPNYPGSQGNTTTRSDPLKSSGTNAPGHAKADANGQTVNITVQGSVIDAQGLLAIINQANRRAAYLKSGSPVYTP